MSDFYGNPKETHETVYGAFRVKRCDVWSPCAILTGGKSKMATEKIRIRLKSYDSKLIDAAAAKIVEAAKKSGAQVSGPIPLPTEKEIITILRAVHKYKDSREQFELRTHKRLIDVLHPSKKFIEELQNVELPAGVDIDLKV